MTEVVLDNCHDFVGINSPSLYIKSIIIITILMQSALFVPRIADANAK